MLVTFQLSIGLFGHFCFVLTTNLLQFHGEVIKIRKILQQNEYTVSLFNNCLGKFLNKIYSTKQPVHTAKKFSLSLLVPILGKQIEYHISSKNEQNITAKYYPNIELKLYCKCTKRLSNLFRVKDIFPYVLKSNVVLVYSLNILVLVVVPARLGKIPAISTLEFVNTWAY